MASGPVPRSGALRRRARVRATLAVALLFALLLGFAIRTLQQRQAERAAFPARTGSLRVAGLGAALVIHRDPRGIPHVEAANESDALFGLGFVHAQDRLAQAEWLRRLARGRTAEILGSDGLPMDLLARTLGFARLADAQVERLSGRVRRDLVAYSAGVNARIDRIRQGLAGMPLVLRDLAVPLEDWTPGDSIAVMKLLAWGVSSSVQESLVLAELIERFGPVGLDLFYPPGSGGSLPGSSDRSAKTPGLRPGRWGRLAAVGATHRGAGGPDPLRAALGLQGRGVGSSAWVVSGAHTAGGRPILGADAHLEAIAPALLYEAHVRGGGLDVAGASIPGTPVFWMGHNRRFAWAATHAAAVVTDLFEETLHPGGLGRYGVAGGWRNLEERIETLVVRGEDPVEWPVRVTRHGPLLDTTLASGAGPLAVSWPGLRPGDGVGSFLALIRAESPRALRRAFAMHHEPALVFVYAGTEGEGGMQLAGSLPRRTYPSGLVPVPGRGPAYDWEGSIPFDRLPRRSLSGSPGSDGATQAVRWLVVADNALPAPRGGEQVEWLWRTGERANRIRELLAEERRRGPLELRRLAALQADMRSNRAPGVVGLALEFLDGPPASLGREAAQVEDLLRGWDGVASSDSTAAALAHVFLDRLLHELMLPRLGAELLARYLALSHSDPLTTLRRLLEPRGEAWGEGWELDSEEVRSAVTRSLRKTWIWLTVRIGPDQKKWSWGALHSLRFRSYWHQGILDPPGSLPYDGDASSVAVADFDPANPFRVRIASTYRFLADTGVLDQALTLLVPGQSEHPGHRHRTDGINDWLEGRPHLLLTGRLLVEEYAAASLELEPLR